MAIVILASMVHESEMIPMPSFVVTRCSGLERPLPNDEIQLLKEKVKKLETGFEKLVNINVFINLIEIHIPDKVYTDAQKAIML